MVKKDDKPEYFPLSPDELRKAASEAGAGIRAYYEYVQQYENESTAEVKLRLFIEYIVQHSPTFGMTRWEAEKLTPYRTLCKEDLPNLEGMILEGVEAHKNRSNPPSSISPVFSNLEAAGIVRWDGHEKRIGGYGAPQKVYRWVPESERKEATEQFFKRKMEEKAHRDFIKQGEAAIIRAITAKNEALSRYEQMKTKLEIITKHYQLPEWLVEGASS